MSPRIASRGWNEGQHGVIIPAGNAIALIGFAKAVLGAAIAGFATVTAAGVKTL